MKKRIGNGIIRGSLDDPNKPKLVYLVGKAFSMDKGISKHVLQQHVNKSHYRNEVEEEVINEEDNVEEKDGEKSPAKADKLGLGF